MSLLTQNISAVKMLKKDIDKRGNGCTFLPHVENESHLMEYKGLSFRSNISFYVKSWNTAIVEVDDFSFCICLDLYKSLALYTFNFIPKSQKNAPGEVKKLKEATAYLEKSFNLSDVTFSLLHYFSDSSYSPFLNAIRTFNTKGKVRYLPLVFYHYGDDERGNIKARCVSLFKGVYNEILLEDYQDLCEDISECHRAVDLFYKNPIDDQHIFGLIPLYNTEATLYINK